MDNHIDIIDMVLQKHLQKNVNLSINNKIIRTGKFILYNFHDYHIQFSIICKNKIKKTLIPIPFKIEHHHKDNLVYFDYRIKALYSGLSPKQCDNKYYNCILEIQFE